MKALFSTVVTILALAFCSAVWAADDGRAIEFQIEENGSGLRQVALIQDQKVYVKQIGGNPTQDILFDAANSILFVIDHQSKSYYRIDRNVINKVASMMDSITDVAKSQQGVLSDLLNTLGLVKDDDNIDVEVKTIDKRQQVFGIHCTLFQEYHNGEFQSEVCIAHKDNLKALGDQYSTLDAFYVFGDKLLNTAGSILTNMGMGMPKLTRLIKGGLPVFIHSVKERVKATVLDIRPQNSVPEYFELPSGYSQTPIPFIG